MMNLVFPILAGGALYSLYSIHKKDAEEGEGTTAEGFSGYHGGPVGGVGTGGGAGSGVGISNAHTLGSNGYPQNYPVVNDKELAYSTTDYPYANPNLATNEYLNQSAYQAKNQKTAYERYQSHDQGSINNPIPQIYSLTGNFLNSDQFKHNNMVPFYGAKPKGQLYHPNTSETILDSMAGSGSQTIKKIEQAPLFAPQDSVQLPYGSENYSDFFESRVVPGTRQNNVQPFESIRVGPGLGHEPGIAGSGGFNSGMEERDSWLPKNVDELRVLTNPKSEYTLLNHEGPAHSVVQNVGLIGQVEKYHPDTFFIQNQDRWLTTNGTEKQGRMTTEFVDERQHHRVETTQAYAGPSVSQLKTASYMPSNHQVPKRITLPVADPLPCAAMGKGNTENANNFFLKSHTNVVNHRSTTQQPASFIGGFSRAVGSTISPLLDFLTPTRREDICGETPIYGVGRKVPSTYVVNAGDNMRTTLKETAIYQPHGYVGTRELNVQGYPEQTPTQKVQRQSECTENFGNASQPGLGSVQGGLTTFSAHKEVEGRANMGGMGVFSNNPFDQSQATRRDQTPNQYITPAFLGGAGGGLGPSTNTYGKIHVPEYYNQCENVGCGRINPDILTAFRDNPYTQSLVNSA